MGLFLFKELQNGLSYFAELRYNGADEIVAPSGPKRASHRSSLSSLVILVLWDFRFGF